MFELTYKIQGEKEYKKHTLEELNEIGEILKDLQTEEVKIRRVDDVRALGEKETSKRHRLSL